MRAPIIELYQDQDFDEVSLLIKNYGMEAPSSPRELSSGLGLLARDETFRGEGEAPIIGFVWALAANGCGTAYVDFFVVRKDLLKTMVGVWLISTLSVMLKSQGIRKIIAVAPPESGALVRMIARRGARDLGQHHVIVMETGHG